MENVYYKRRSFVEEVVVGGGGDIAGKRLTELAMQITEVATWCQDLVD